MRIQVREVRVTQEFFSKKPQIDFDPVDEREIYHQLSRSEMCDFLRSEGYAVIEPEEKAA